jgi:hypothetical protein
MSITKARAYTEQELLTEIFGFIPDRIVEHIYDFINGILYEVIEGLNSRLAELCPEEEQKISEVRVYIQISEKRKLNSNCSK